MGVRFSVLIENGSDARPVLSIMGAGSFPRQNGRGVVLPTHLFLVPGCEWVGAAPLCACIDTSWGDPKFLGVIHYKTPYE